jgi:anti-sigma factor RsiW
MVTHIAETDLALYVSGDLRLLRRAAVGFHAGRCERCRRRMEAYRADRDQTRKLAGEMPEGLDWQRLAAEMSANIHVGLAAGECVARRPERRILRVSWRPAAIAAGMVAVMTFAWWLNMPAGTSGQLGRAMSAIWHGRANFAAVASRDASWDAKRNGPASFASFGPVVVATPLGIELRENDNVIGGSEDSAPVAVSASMQGSASARYVNADTGQMTITSVYVQ